MTFEVKILGCNSASFAFGRHHTSQLVNSNQNLFLIDCGEATQIQLIRHQVRFSRVNQIFISHLHGDHFLGLMGLIFTYHLQGRKEDLHVYGPKGLDEIITIQLKHSESQLSYPLHFHLIEADNQVIFENEDLQVSTIQMNHRIACFGFVFQEKERKFKLIREALPQTLSRENILALKEGMDVTDLEGKFWANSDLALPPHKPRKYVYCSDTRYLEHMLESVSGADLLYHEATFLTDMQDRAENTFHTTAAEAGKFAQRHQVKELIIGHFSSRYYDLVPFLEEAKTQFPDTLLAYEGQTYEVSPIHEPKSIQVHA